MSIGTIYVGSVVFNGRTIPLYDSGILYQTIDTQNINDITSVVQTLHIPSSRNYYYSTNGHVIPYLGLANPEQVRRDVSAWRTNLRKINRLTSSHAYLPSSFSTIYRREIVPSSGDINVDLISITQGIAVLPPTTDIARTYAQLQQFFSEFTRNGQLSFYLSTDAVKLMFLYPLNPATNFIEAAKLANNGSSRDIQEYLNNLGIFTFTADNIYQLDTETKFFYLTRFYGPPKYNNLDAAALQTKYMSRVETDNARSIVEQLSSNIDTYNKFKHEFELFFDAINKGIPVMENLGATNEQRFYNSFFDYLKLLGVPSNLPLLSLETIRTIPNEVQLREFLSNYSDTNLILFVGKGLEDYSNRSNMIEKAVDILTSHKAIILTPDEASLCINNETLVSIEAFSEFGALFIGLGSIAAGFNCYDIFELFQSFESNKDKEGTYTFRNPLDYNQNLSLDELKMIRNALKEERRGIPVNRELFEQINRYIAQGQLQESSGYKQIRRLRTWVEESDQNKQLMDDLWITFFHMSMYMRQWEGPGHPYPLTKQETGQELEVATTGEVELSQNVTDENARFIGLMNQFPQEIQDLIWGLKLYSTYGGEPTQRTETITYSYNRTIIRGVACIRMASSVWGFTAAYYHKQILGTDIPGYNLTENIDMIS